MKMHKILAVLAFAGVFAGGAYGAEAPARGAEVAQAVNTIFGGLVAGGFKANDLNSAEDVAAAFAAAHAGAWERIVVLRGEGKSFDDRWFTRQEVESVLTALTPVVDAYEAAVTVIWKATPAKRDAYKDAVLAALDQVLVLIKAKVAEAVSPAVGAIYPQTATEIDAHATERIQALKARVTAVFTNAPVADGMLALNAGGQAGAAQVDDLRQLPQAEPQFWGPFVKTSVLALGAAYVIPAVIAYLTGAPVA